jgi:hypothetical protein
VQLFYDFVVRGQHILHVTVLLSMLVILTNCILRVGRDNVVNIANRNGMDGTGIESRRGRNFSQPSRPALGPTQPLIQWVPGLVSFAGVKRPGRGVDHPQASSARVKERVEV